MQAHRPTDHTTPPLPEEEEHARPRALRVSQNTENQASDINNARGQGHSSCTKKITKTRQAMHDQRHSSSSSPSMSIQRTFDGEKGRDIIR